MKILIINYEYPPLGGGGGVATYDLAVEWAKVAQVDVLTSSYEGLEKYEKMDGVNVHRVKVLGRNSRDAASFISMLTYLITAFFRGIKLIRKNRYDVINTHFAVPSGPVGYLLGKIFRIPNVLSLHGGDIYDPSKKISPHRSFIFKRVVKFILNRANRIIAQSSNTKNNADKYYKPKKYIEIIPLAFHEPKIRNVTKEEIGYSKNDFLLTAIGRIVKRKALDVVIKALSKIENSNVKFLIMGDGPERSNLEDLVKKLDLSERVKFAGFVSQEEKYDYLCGADLFTLTSLHEGFGIVYMEAMYCEIPIICADEGGQVDFLKHEENALLIDVGNVDKCAEYIERFYKDKKLYKKCVKNNKEKVKDFYAENVANEYLKVFNDLISNNGEK